MKKFFRFLLTVIMLAWLIYSFIFPPSSANAETVYSYTGYLQWGAAATGPTGIMYSIDATEGEVWDITINYAATVNCTTGVVVVGTATETLGHFYFPDIGSFTGSLHFLYYVPRTQRDTVFLGAPCYGSSEIPRIELEMTYTLTVRVLSQSDPLPITTDPALPINIHAPTIEEAAAGEQYMDIWQLDEHGNGQPALSVSAEEINDLPDHPSENTLIDSTSDGFIRVYKLTTGEFQINIGPLPDGKIHVLIFDQIPPTHRYGYTIPN